MKKFFTLIAVAVMAFAAQANVLTVAEGTVTNGHFPFYGLYNDTQGTQCQVIYPADMLADMVGCEITELKFYTRDEISPRLDGSKMKVSMKEVAQNEYATSVPVELGDEDLYGYCTPIPGETEVVITLDKPFVYAGGNLLLETVVIEVSNYNGTYFYGQDMGTYCAFYTYVTSYGTTPAYTEAFLPKTTFTYNTAEGPVDPPTPGEPCAKPEGGFVNGVDFHGVLVTLINNETAEGAELHYNITLDGVMIVEDAIYEDAFALTVDGEYYIDFWATAPGMQESSHGGLIFTIDPTTGLSELLEGKTVAGVRYYNLVGQEMAQPAGMTIVVTTYTDGTTSAVKVVK